MLLTWLDASSLEKVLQSFCIIVLVFQSVANIIPQLGVVLVNLQAETKLQTMFSHHNEHVLTH